MPGRVTVSRRASPIQGNLMERGACGSAPANQPEHEPYRASSLKAKGETMTREQATSLLMKLFDDKDVADLLVSTAMSLGEVGTVMVGYGFVEIKLQDGEFKVTIGG